MVAPMLKICPHRWSRALKRLPGRLAAAGLLLLAAACATGDSAGDTDNAKNHGFYGSVTGGWTHP
jgi:hypothetical protein